MCAWRRARHHSRGRRDGRRLSQGCRLGGRRPGRHSSPAARALPRRAPRLLPLPACHKGTPAEPNCVDCPALAQPVRTSARQPSCLSFGPNLLSHDGCPRRQSRPASGPPARPEAAERRAGATWPAGSPTSASSRGPTQGRRRRARPRRWPPRSRQTRSTRAPRSWSAAWAQRCFRSRARLQRPLLLAGHRTAFVRRPVRLRGCMKHVTGARVHRGVHISTVRRCAACRWMRGGQLARPRVRASGTRPLTLHPRAAAGWPCGSLRARRRARWRCTTSLRAASPSTRGAERGHGIGLDITCMQCTL